MEQPKPKKVRLRFRTVVLSDIHMGFGPCKIDEVNHFLKHVVCDTLILNGDIIDTWELKRRAGRWTTKHSRFMKHVFNKISKHNTRVIYTRGNHDDLLERLMPFEFAGVQLLREYVHLSATGHSYLVTHGDVLDPQSKKFRFLSQLGHVGYSLLLGLNLVYNRYRSLRGKPAFSFSAAIKSWVKSKVNKPDTFDRKVADLARRGGHYGVIMGHIHTAANRFIDGVHYLNSGDWVESKTALVEHYDGSFEVLEYQDFCNRLYVAQQFPQAVPQPMVA